MPRMIELIRQSGVPSHVMRSAAHGALSLPAGEMLEILVLLTRNPVFAEQARMTLAQWDENSAREVMADRATSWEVLEYFFAAANRRPRLMPALLDNPTVRESWIVDLAQTASREYVEMLLKSARVLRCPEALHALSTNAHVNDAEQQKIKDALKSLGYVKEEAGSATGALSQYEIEHAAEIAAEEGKPFELVGGDILEDAEPEEAKALAAAAAAQAEVDAKALQMREAQAKANERVSTLQKIARLSVGDRVQLAMKGNKEERFILIRDGSKVVSSAVLQSPKLSDAEVETFAAMKNVQESVLRDIARTRKFMKNYAVIRCLVNNPRCPLDLSLNLMNHLLVGDLKGLSMNKNVPDTLRKLALKSFKQKSTPAGKKAE